MLDLVIHVVTTSFAVMTTAQSGIHDPKVCGVAQQVVYPEGVTKRLAYNFVSSSRYVPMSQCFWETIATDVPERRPFGRPSPLTSRRGRSPFGPERKRTSDYLEWVTRFLAVF